MRGLVRAEGKNQTNGNENVAAVRIRITARHKMMVAIKREDSMRGRIGTVECYTVGPLRRPFLVLAIGASVAMSCAHGADLPGCRHLAAVAGGADDNFRPPLSAMVTGSGRAYFHSAPAAECVSKHTFLVPGDTVTIYKPYENWYQVMYVNGKTGEDFQGWIEEGRLRLGRPFGGD